MRFLIVDHLYPSFVASVYDAAAGLSKAPYEEQRAVFDHHLFGETRFEVRAIQRLGHEAEDVLVNVDPLNRAWAVERGIDVSARAGGLRDVIRSVRLRTTSVDQSLLLGAHIAAFEPDVLYVQCVDALRPDTLRALRLRVRLIVGQIAAPLPAWLDLEPYHLVISSLPNFIEKFRAEGKNAEWLPLAFEPSIVDEIGEVDRDVAVSFVGSLSRHHTARVQLLESVAREVGMDVWSVDAAALDPGSPLHGSLRGPAWGRDMYRVLGRSRITLNNHIGIAAGYANNLRLYEATGMGALLMTEEAPNLGELFEVGREVVAYRDARHLGELIRYYRGRPAEAAEVARRGQARTLADHTWTKRMERLVAILEPLIRN